MGKCGEKLIDCTSIVWFSVTSFFIFIFIFNMFSSLLKNMLTPRCECWKEMKKCINDADCGIGVFSFSPFFPHNFFIFNLICVCMYVVLFYLNKSSNE